MYRKSGGETDMIEIPESLVLAEQLNKTIRGRQIAFVETEHTEHKFAWYTGDPQEYDEKMSSHVVGNSTGIGSMVEMEIGGYETKLSRKNIGYCPHCGSPVQKTAYLGGNVYFCPACQPLT